MNKFIKNIEESYFSIIYKLDNGTFIYKTNNPIEYENIRKHYIYTRGNDLYIRSGIRICKYINYE